jgi:C4-dicarboxylate-specific signal transduction histidine kinase/ABC-type uncharacterized transport system substrate-binding protein
MHRISLLVPLLLAPTTRASAQRTHGPIRVLVVFQQQAETRPMVEFTDRLRQTVPEELRSPVEFYQEALDLDRFKGASRVSPLVGYFANKYRGFGIDVVVPVGRRALEFILSELDEVLPNTPVVFALNAAPQLDTTTLPPRVTGRIASGGRFAPTVEMARALQPDAERIVVVGGAGATDSVAVAAVVSAATASRVRLPITVIQGPPLNALLGQLRALPPRSIVIFANFRQDANGQVFEPLDVVGSIARASAAPMYTQLDSYVGEGLVGGSVLKFDDEGARTGHLVARVLLRKPGQGMPPIEGIGNSYVVDARQLRRWGLSEAHLPPGTEVRFREPTFWERYRTLALAASMVIVAESALVGGLLIERRRRRRAQAAIARQEELNHAVLASVSTQIAIIDRAGRIIRVNEAWRALARDARADEAHDAFVGWNYLEECRRAEDRGCNEAREVRLGIEAVLEGRRWPFRQEFDTAPPHELRYELFVDRLQLSGGGAIVTHLDITERRIAEQRIEETRRQVAHMGRLAVVGELGAAISHELRQPLAAIRANAQAGALLLAGNPPDLTEVQAILQDIVADDARAVEVIEGVRRLLRKDAARSAMVDLNQICRDTARLLQAEAALRGTRLDLALATPAPMVTGDPAQLRQLVLNLGLNALEAASMAREQRSVAIRTTVHADHAELTVHDSGPGISADVQLRVFDPFFSTKADGLGLGLAIVRSIAERHQGRVWAENHPAGGALFGAALPTASDVTPPADATITARSDRAVR